MTSTSVSSAPSHSGNLKVAFFIFLLCSCSNHIHRNRISQSLNLSTSPYTPFSPAPSPLALGSTCWQLLSDTHFLQHQKSNYFPPFCNELSKPQIRRGALKNCLWLRHPSSNKQTQKPFRILRIEANQHHGPHSLDLPRYSAQVDARRTRGSSLAR